jgi:hypothetical protein
MSCLRLADAMHAVIDANAPVTDNLGLITREE